MHQASTEPSAATAVAPKAAHPVWDKAVGGVSQAEDPLYGGHVHGKDERGGRPWGVCPVGCRGRVCRGLDDAWGHWETHEDGLVGRGNALAGEGPKGVTGSPPPGAEVLL